MTSLHAWRRPDDFARRRRSATVPSNRFLWIACVVSVAVVPGAVSATTCDQTSRLERPVEMGTSGGSISQVRRIPHGDSIQIACGGGTLGALVQDATGRQFILSNAHVIGRNNAARPGEGIVQPGLPYVRCEKKTGDVVARFSRRMRLKFGRNGANVADAAIALVTPDRVSSLIRNIGGVSGVLATPHLGLEVQKMGATTCLTEGVVAAVGVDAEVRGYSPPGKPPRTARFSGQIIVTTAGGVGAIGDEGDSGSVVVTTGACPQPVALLFAGSPVATLASPLAPVLSTLGVSFVEGCSAGATSRGAPGGRDPRVTSAAISTAAARRDAHREGLMNVPGALGTGIGLGTATDPVAIEVYVAKRTPEALAAVPASLDGVPVRVKETGPFVAW